MVQDSVFQKKVSIMGMPIQSFDAQSVKRYHRDWAFALNFTVFISNKVY